MAAVPLFRVTLTLPDGRAFQGAFTVSPKRGPSYDFVSDATYQFSKKVESMVRVAEGRPRPGDIDQSFPLALHEVGVHE